jgi:hypothetical protein
MEKLGSLADESIECPVRLPALLYDDDILLPLKVDVSHRGARYVDTFSWRLFNSLMSVDEFACRTCLDLNLPAMFQWRIALQLHEQIDAYKNLLLLLDSVSSTPGRKWVTDIRDLQQMSVGIRDNSLEYNDKFTYDTSSSSSHEPEMFARTVCYDIGLPAEMEPVIAHRIRETIFRSAIHSVDQETLLEGSGEAAPLHGSVVSVKVVAPHHAVDMVNNLWKRARPATIDEVGSVPQPNLPKDRGSNAGQWRSV